LKYNIAVAFWSGEELGLIGSSDFTQNNAGGNLPMENIAAYLNFDMVGMLNQNLLILQGLGSSDAWKSLVERKNFNAGFQLSLSDDPYVPTDGMALYQAGIPILCFFTGLHDHYHMPTDDAENLNYEGMKRIADYALQILLDLNSSEPIAYQKVEMNAVRAGSMRGFTVSLGTIPDYASTVKGVKLSGVREGGAAEKAGLQAGDIIIKMAGKDMNDLYDYTYALSDLKPGVEIEVVIERNGETLTLKMTPEGR
jgi:C-terminal processing protease CtpA/Prc